jgi:hypothetical protein
MDVTGRLAGWVRHSGTPAELEALGSNGEHLRGLPAPEPGGSRGRWRGVIVPLGAQISPSGCVCSIQAAGIRRTSHAVVGARSARRRPCWRS